VLVLGETWMRGGNGAPTVVVALPLRAATEPTAARRWMERNFMFCYGWVWGVGVELIEWFRGPLFLCHAHVEVDLGFRNILYWVANTPPRRCCTRKTGLPSICGLPQANHHHGRNLPLDLWSV